MQPQPADSQASPDGHDYSLNDSSRLRLPFKWLLALVAACVTLGGGYAVGQVQIAMNSKTIAAQAEKIREREVVDQDHEARLRVAEDRYGRILGGLERLERKLDESERRHHP